MGGPPGRTGPSGPPRLQAVPWLVLITLVLLLAGVQPAVAQDDRQVLTTPRPVEVSGAFNVTTTDGGLHLHGSGEAISFSTRAPEAFLTYVTRSGSEAGPPWDEDAVRPDADVETKTRSLHNLSIEVDPGADPLQLAVVPEGRSMIQVEGDGSVSHEPRPPSYLTRIGDSPNRTGTENSSFGFWYAPPERWLTGTGADEGTVTGEVLLVINNATVTLREDGDVVWQNWTGYREGTDAQVARTYEERMLKLHLTDTRLHIQAPGQIELLGSTLDLEATGVITSDATQGTIETTSGRFLFQDQPLRLEGTGGLTLSKRSPATLGLVAGDDAAFSVKGGQRLETPGGVLAPAPGSSLLWGGLGLTVLAVGAVAVHRTGALTGAVSGWRDRRYTRWMTHGRELVAGRDFEEATACFRRAIGIKPDRGAAWYHLAMATLESRDFEGALAVVEELRAAGAIVDELDILELEAEAAYHAGRIERCRRALTDLADESETMAAGLAHDLALDAETLGPELATRFGQDDEPGGLPGYV